MGELHIRLSAMLMALIFRGLSVSVQGVGCLVLWAVISPERDELDFLRISPLDFGPLALIHVMEVILKVGIILKFLGQRHHDLMQVV